MQVQLFMVNDGSVILRGLQTATGSPTLVCSPSLAPTLQLAPGAIRACQTAHTVSSQDELESGTSILTVQLRSLNIPTGSSAPYTKTYEVPVDLRGSASLQVAMVTGTCVKSARAREYMLAPHVVCKPRLIATSCYRVLPVHMISARTCLEAVTLTCQCDAPHAVCSCLLQPGTSRALMVW